MQLDESVKNKALIAGSLFLILFSLSLLAFVMRPGAPSVDSPPFEGKDPNDSRQVHVTGGEELFQKLGTMTAFEFLTADLYTFAQTAYTDYQGERPAIGFKVNSLSQEADKVVVRGVFGASDNPILVTVQKKNIGRIALSILDEKTQLSFDPLLLSNSQLNKFIGTLPQSGEGYTIDYVRDENFFTINVFNNASNYDKAVAKMKQALGEEIFTDQEIVRLGAGTRRIDNGF